MTAHIAKPFVHVEDSNGNPYVSASLYVYDVGTTNLKSIYSNTGLSVALDNPLTSDTAGNFARAYVASGSYKLRAETATASLIWEIDNIDTGLTSGSGPLAISAGGTGATSAASARTALGAAAQTDVDDLSDDIATLSSSLQNLTASPQGRLTLVSGVPVPASDVISGASVYYTPHVGAQLPIYNGTQFALSTFAQLTLTMNANHLANQIYDVFIWKEGDVVTIGTGPGWNTVTAGSGARGSGAGTTQIERVGGIWVNAVEITARNGSTTYTVAENLATYVGSILIDGTNGQVSSHVTAGQSRKPGPWNAYNRIRRILKVTDPTASWTYASTSRVSHADATNVATTLCGLPDEPISITFRQKVDISLGAADIAESNIGVGVNGSFAGMAGMLYLSVADTTRVAHHITASNVVLPNIGIQNITTLESAPTADGTQTFWGTEPLMCMYVEWGA